MFGVFAARFTKLFVFKLSFNFFAVLVSIIVETLTNRTLHFN